MRMEKVKRHLEWIGLRGSRWAWAATLSAIAFWASVAHSPGRSQELPTSSSARQSSPLQEYTAGTDPIHFIGSTTLYRLPDPYPNQKKPPCEAQLEEAIDGYCWTYLGAKPPCPENKAWERDGKCYQRALRAMRVPTTGDPQIPHGVSEPNAD